jgi:hypothetical protein
MGNERDQVHHDCETLLQYKTLLVTKGAQVDQRHLSSAFPFNVAVHICWEMTLRVTKLEGCTRHLKQKLYKFVLCALSHVNILDTPLLYSQIYNCKSNLAAEGQIIIFLHWNMFEVEVSGHNLTYILYHSPILGTVCKTKEDAWSGGLSLSVNYFERPRIWRDFIKMEYGRYLLNIVGKFRFWAIWPIIVHI